jgi:hypothetical protein
VGGLGHHTIQVGNGNNILIDGSASVSSGSSFRGILNIWTQNPNAQGQAAADGQLQHEVRQLPVRRQRYRLVLLQTSDDLEQEAHGFPELIARHVQSDPQRLPLRGGLDNV